LGETAGDEEERWGAGAVDAPVRRDAAVAWAVTLYVHPIKMR
jgi:hypothetical protein